MSLCTGGWKRCLWCHKEGVEKLVLAGLFIDQLDYFAPNDIEENEFDQHIVNHTSIAKVPTPFISTFQSMLCPVHRAIQHKEGAIVTIIDSKKLQTQVFSAKRFIRKIGLKVGNYTGAGEYLIWGKVASSAIICSFKISSLLQITSEYPHIESILQLGVIGTFEKAGRPLHRALANSQHQLDHKSGLVIRELLTRLQVPQQYCHIVAEGIVYSWRFNRKDGSWQDFFEGVRGGDSSQPEVPLPHILDADNMDLLGESSDEDTVTDGESYSIDDQSDDGSRADTPCPTERPTRATLPLVELFDVNNRRWIAQEDDTREAIMIDGSEDEIDEGTVDIEDILTPNGFSKISLNINTDNHETESSPSASLPPVSTGRVRAHQPEQQQDQFAIDRARVYQVLN
ncbi:hypothetical protein BDV28DRAFT_164582 [Aspergillus coremiiformis]|uniref:DUF7587 domain-containing protein n=1 Tax=Aspergillus coremiiformis TaxID=138285 RepID=A0A5N6ZB91_9EURO|nr:hypothetical protein BDV28DRAFT_164582 [Aspergillus coremiiformis]